LTKKTVLTPKAPDPDLALSGSPRDVVGLLVTGRETAGVEVEGDHGALETLRAMVVLPDRLRGAALAESESPAPA
jgi:hypothetical protein